MILSESLRCPSCGAPVRIEHPRVRMCVCSYCGSVLWFRGSHLSDTGQRATLLEYPSILRIGVQAELDGISFRVMGVLQYAYRHGVWEEWLLLTPEGRIYWLEEDEGELTLFRKEHLVAPIPPYPEIRVGDSLSVNGLSFFVVEKRRAIIQGAAGQLTFTVTPGTEIAFVDGTARDEVCSIEFYPEEIELCRGKVFSIDKLHILSSNG
ncbi:MAG: DUF4178 domain-containing protein [Bacteroidia bacterium]|nr:DUF4178 domain-containing protein [Bacteroidia bacterium]